MLCSYTKEKNELFEDIKMGLNISHPCNYNNADYSVNLELLAHESLRVLNDQHFFLKF